MSAMPSVHIQVRAAFTNNSNFQSDAADQDGFPNPEALADRLHPCGAIRTAFGDRHPRRDLLGRNMQRAYRAVRFEKGSKAVSSIVELFRRGLINDTENRRSVDNEPDLNCKFGPILDELSRAVHRINHPHMRSRESGEVIRLLLAEHGVIGKLAFEGADNEL